MIVSELTMQKVEEKEKYNMDLYRCLNVSVCPQCGSDLIKQTDSTATTKYICGRCTFTYTRPV